MMRVEAGQGPAEPQSARNEVDEFHDHRALGAAEACWRLYSNDMSGRSPAVLALTVHLENGLRVCVLHRRDRGCRCGSGAGADASDGVIRPERANAGERPGAARLP